MMRVLGNLYDKNSYKKNLSNFFIFLLFGWIAILLMSPLASNTYLPYSPDYANHTALLIQAKMALSEGQFPILTAPWQFNGLYYPVFQFYSPLPYMIGAIIYEVLTPSNPFVAFKIMIWLFLTLGGVYMYRAVRLLIVSDGGYIAALLAAVAYMMAPYFIINVDIRGAFTEAIAQGVLPIVLYYTLRIYLFNHSLKYFCYTSLSWFALATTHLITFVYTSFFIGLFLLLLTIKNRKYWKQLIYTGISYGYSWLLALWFLVPICVVEKHLNIHNQLDNPSYYNWLTPLSELFSVKSVSPMPIPGNGSLPFPLYPSVGWCISLAVGVCIYSVTILPKSDYYIGPIKTLLILFCLALFITWSPFDFWKYLPASLGIAQFSYRFLTQVMWIGALLLALAVFLVCKEKLSARDLVVGILLIGLASSTWLHTSKNNSVSISELIRAPDMGYGSPAYLIKSESIVNYAGVQLPLFSSDDWLNSNQEIKVSSNLLANNPKIKLHFEGEMAHPYIKPPVTLTVEINGIRRYSKQLNISNFSVNLPLGQIFNDFKNTYKRFDQPFVGIRLLTDSYFIPHRVNPDSSDSRQLSIIVKDIQLTAASSSDTALPKELIRPRCQRVRTKMVCKIDIGPQSNLVELPILYYPGLLEVKANGKNIDYFPISSGKVLVTAGVKLSPGNYDLQFSFVGIKSANWVSFISWLILSVILLISFFNNKQKIRGHHLTSTNIESLPLFRDLK